MIGERKNKGLMAIFVFILGLLCFQLFSSAEIMAAPINENAPLYNSSTIAGQERRPYYAVGNGAFNGEFSWVKVYVPVGQSTTITIDQACSLDVGTPSVTYYLNDLADGSAATSDQSETYSNGDYDPTPYNVTRADNYPCANTITFPTIDATNDGIPSKILGHEKWRVFFLVAKISTAAGDNERSFIVNSSNSASYVGAGKRINDGGAAAAGIGSSNDNGFNVYQRNAPSLGSDTWDFEIEFAPTCREASSNTTKTLRFFDLDDGVYSPQNLGMVIRRDSRAPNPSYTSNYDTKNSFINGSGHRDEFAFTANNNYMYKLYINGMNYRNTIQIQLPFDQIDALPTVPPGQSNCNPPPSGGSDTLGICDTTVNFQIPSGKAVHVRVYAKDAAGDPGSPVYDAYHQATENVDLRGDVGWDKLRSNNGFWVLTKPANPIYNSDGDRVGWDDYGPNQELGPGSPYRDWNTGACFSATCTVDINRDFPNGGIKENTGKTATIIVNNTTPGSVRIPGAIDGVRAFGIRSAGDIGTGTYAMADGGGPTRISSGGNWVKYAGISVPGGRANHTVRGAPAFINRTGSGAPSFDIGSECGPTVPTYQEFNMNQNVDAVADDIENPTSISATANIFRDGYTTDAPLQNGTLRLYRQSTNQTLGTAAVPAAIAGNVPVGPVTYTSAAGVRAAGWVVGEQYCASISYNYQHGWWGPGGNSDIEGPPTPGYANNCDPITNRPYLSAYGGDVGAGGGGLGLPCSNSGSIGAYYKSAGSGAQYAAYAMESISGFKSAFLRDASFPTAPRSPNDLTFGNTPGLGQYKLVDCATDFYSVDQYEDGDSRKNTAIPGSISAAGLPDGGQSVRTGNLTLNGGGFTGKHSVFVDGDVFITGNIAYSTTSWANIAEIPYFNLVVRGNIYISQDVTQLDGRYIAQPRSATDGGHIYTCAYAPGHPSAGQPVPTNPGSELWNQCGGATNNRRLVINGQFVARTVHFLRTINTISDGVGRETIGNSKAGEVFSLSPEIFLGQPANRPKSTSTSGEYQNITTLPPIL